MLHIELIKDVQKLSWFLGYKNRVVTTICLQLLFTKT
jgi:hypothetical protein